MAARTGVEKTDYYKSKQYWIFTVAYRLNGRTVRKNFSSERRARDFASDTATALEKGNRQVLSLNAADWQSYLAAKNLLRPFGIPLHTAIEEYVAIRRRKKVIEKRVGDVCRGATSRETERRIVQSIR